MKTDLSNCEIRMPTGDERLPLYRLLMEIFPTDRPLITELIAEEYRFPNWPAYTLCSDNEVLGNVSLAPMQVWLDGRSSEVVGIAWVVTREEYRRQGVASRLLRRALEVVDEQGLPSVLFTGLPGVYEPLGFEVVPQVYLAAPAQQLASGRPKSDSRIHQILTPNLVETMARIHAQDNSNHDGKVVRDAKYWQLYRALFNANPNVRLLVHEQEDRAVGYVRIETENDRLLVSELCCPPAAVDVAQTLLGCVAELATDTERETITLALPRDHPAMRILRRSAVVLEPEPAGASRETFMVRAPESQVLGAIGELQWPLCDKF
jgi:predicted acetyltransferase